MKIEWRDGFGAWTATPRTETADDAQVTFAAEDTVIGQPGRIAAEDAAVEWRDGFGDWAS